MFVKSNRLYILRNLSETNRFDMDYLINTRRSPLCAQILNTLILHPSLEDLISMLKPFGKIVDAYVKKIVDDYTFPVIRKNAGYTVVAFERVEQANTALQELCYT